MHRLTACSIVFWLLAASATPAAAQQNPAADTLASGRLGEVLTVGEGRNVAVIWLDKGAGWVWSMRRSTDSGRTFGPNAPLEFLDGVIRVKAAASANRIHFCWTSPTRLGTHQVTYAHLDLGTGAVSAAKRLSPTGDSANTCLLSVSAGHLVVAWQSVAASQAVSGMLVRPSFDDGLTFQEEIELGWTQGGYLSLAPGTGDQWHAAWETGDPQDKGLWSARIDIRKRRVRKQRLLTGRQSLNALRASGSRVVIGSGKTVLISNDGGGRFDRRFDVTPPLTSLYPDVNDGRVGITIADIYVERKLVGVLSRKGYEGDVYFTAVDDSAKDLVFTQNLTPRTFFNLRQGSFGYYVFRVGTALVVAWTELDGDKHEVYLAYSRSLTDGLTFDPVNRVPIHTGRGKGAWAAAAQPATDAMVFIWLDQADEGRDGNVTLRVLRVTP
jgi:hypothetical protein